MENKIDNIELKKAFTETFIILNQLNLYNRLPNEFKNYIEQNLIIEHKFSFNQKIPLFEQVDNKITKNLLTYIYINYINTDENVNKFFEEEIIKIINKTYTEDF